MKRAVGTSCIVTISLSTKVLVISVPDKRTDIPAEKAAKVVISEKINLNTYVTE